MKLAVGLILAIGLILAPSTQASATPYFKTIVGDPTHPKVSATLLYTSRFDFDGGLTDVAIAYHKADPSDSLWPQKLLDAGFPPISWTLLEVGAGGNRQSGFIHAGASVNIAPTLLGPAVAALKNAGGKSANFAALLVSPDGNGLKLGLGWKANLIQDGGFVRLNQLRFPPRYGVGYMWVF